VLREHKKVDEPRERGKSFSKSVLAEERDGCVADARQHLAGVDEIAPKEMDWISAEAEVVRLERECHGLEADIRANLVDLTLELKEREIQLPAGKLELNSLLEPLADRDHERIGRLRSWLKENRGSISVVDDRLVVPAPQAILTIIARHQDTSEVRDLLGRALIENLLREAEQKRWPVVAGSAGLKLCTSALASRDLESKIVTSQIADPLVQDRLQASSEFPRLWEYILIWQREQDVRKALKARQAELKPTVAPLDITESAQSQQVSSVGPAPVIASQPNGIDLPILAAAYAKVGGRAAGW
jgi:hypothetical protein